MKYLLAVVLSVALLGPAAAQADTATPTPRVRLIRVLTDTNQALVMDKIQGKYVVVRVNERVQGFKVTSIQRDQLVLSRDRQHYIIPLIGNPPAKAPAKTVKTAPAPSPTSVPLPPPPPEPVATRTKSNAKPTSELLNPYPPKKKLTTVLAPPGLRFDPREKPLEAKAPNKPESTDKLRDNKRIASVKPLILEPTRLVPKPSAEQTQTIHRDEFDKAVADFTALAKEVQFRRDGKRILITGIARGSYFYRLGLRKGDRILKVARIPIRSMDDAAVVYARLMASSRFSVEIERNNSLIKLRYSFDK